MVPQRADGQPPLQAQGVHIWDGNTSREFLDKLGLTDLRRVMLAPFMGTSGATGARLT